MNGEVSHDERSWPVQFTGLIIIYVDHRSSEMMRKLRFINIDGKLYSVIAVGCSESWNGLISRVF